RLQGDWSSDVCSSDLRRAVKEVAQEHKLPDNWMSDAVKGFADILPHDFYHRLVPLDLPFERLRLYVLGLPEQVAMKIVALREQEIGRASCRERVESCV